MEKVKEKVTLAGGIPIRAQKGFSQGQDEQLFLGKTELKYMQELAGTGGKAIGLLTIGKKFDVTLGDISKRWHNLQRKGFVTIEGLSGSARRVVTMTSLGKKALDLALIEEKASEVKKE